MARLVGINHVALEVGDVEEALAWYGRFFEFEVDLSERDIGMAFLQMGDQFLALAEVPEPHHDAERHFGLVVDVDKPTVRAALEAAGVEVIVAPGENEGARVRSALSELGARGVQSLLLEGGPHLAGAFLDAGEIDEIRLFLAPLVIGGRTARDPLEGEGVERIAEALRALTLDCDKVADDLLISARLREW